MFEAYLILRPFKVSKLLFYAYFFDGYAFWNLFRTMPSSNKKS